MRSKGIILIKCFPRENRIKEEKLILLSDVKDKNVFIDSYNVLITVKASRSGDKFLLHCDDGVTRYQSCFREIQK